MKPNYNAREGLKTCVYAEIGFAFGSLAILGGLIGTLFSIFVIAAYIIRLRGMKHAVRDNAEYMRASRLLMIGLAVTASLVLISFYRSSYVYTTIMLEMNTILVILSTFLIFRATLQLLEYNGRTELVDSGKKAWTIYWITYAIFLIAALAQMFEPLIGGTIVLVLKIVAILLAFFASWTFYKWLNRTAPVL